MFAFLLVQMFPGIIILVPYFLVMKTLGLLNSHLGLILAYCVTALPLCVWMLKGFFDTVLGSWKKPPCSTVAPNFKSSPRSSCRFLFLRWP